MYGRRVCIKVSPSQLLLHFSTECPGAYVPPSLPVTCKGLVCGNFGTKRRHWDPCQRAWHGSCYRQKEADRFPIQSTRGQEEVDFEEEDGVAKEGDRFRVGLAGDHLLCPFQCALCHFQNIQRRLPGSDPRDKFFGVCIGRANLDALWAREASTVESNQREGKHVRKAAATFGVNHQWDRVTGRTQLRILGECLKQRAFCCVPWTLAGIQSSFSMIPCDS
jgi:hypothetical protein